MYKVIYFMAKDATETHEMYKIHNLYEWMIPSINYCDKTNDNCEIHIITDIEELDNIFKSNKIYVHHFNDYYSDDIDWFDKSYIHLSTNQYQFEKNAIIRLFYLRNFCIKNNINSFLHIESDVIVFSDIIKDSEYFKEKIYDITLLHNIAFGVCFFNNGIKILNEITDCIINSYSIPQKEPKAFDIEIEKNSYEKNILNDIGAGGVSDMHFWSWYKDTHDNVLKEMNTNDNGIFYQTCLMGWEIEKWENFKDSEINTIIKKLEISNNKCYGHYMGEKVEIKYLHCHGHTKKLISKYI